MTLPYEREWGSERGIFNFGQNTLIPETLEPAELFCRIRERIDFGIAFFDSCLAACGDLIADSLLLLIIKYDDIALLRADEFRIVLKT